MPIDTVADARAALEHFRSRFREEAGRHPGLRAVLIEASDLPDVMDVPPVIEGGRTIAHTDKEHGRIWVFIDSDHRRLRAAIDALGTLAGTAIGMLSKHGIFQPTEPPPDLTAPWVHVPDAWIRGYHAREWLLFLHRQARERPGAPPGLRSTPCVGSFKLSGGALAHALECGAFEASALILGRLLSEATEAAGESPGRQAAGADAKPKRARRPRRISKVQRALVLLSYRAKTARESIRVEDIAGDPYVACTAQNLYKSPEFMKEYEAACARRIRRGWKVEGVADCPDDSTLDVG